MPHPEEMEKESSDRAPSITAGLPVSTCSFLPACRQMEVVKQHLFLTWLDTPILLLLSSNKQRKKSNHINNPL
jgi:hypothetical protein